MIISLEDVPDLFLQLREAEAENELLLLQKRGSTDSPSLIQSHEGYDHMHELKWACISIKDVGLRVSVECGCWVQN